MPKGYHHLTYERRCQLYALKSSGMLQKDIASQLGVSPATISRELKRNMGARGYRYHQAHNRAIQRRRLASAEPLKMTPVFLEHLLEKLKVGWSPEQIAGRFKLEGTPVSHETIYRYLRADKKNGGTLYRYLRRRGKKYNKRLNGRAGRGHIPNRVDISERPTLVERKERVGDWEGDTIIGANHQGALLTYVDRKSKFTIISKLAGKQAQGVTEKSIERFSEFSRLVKTITYDNGKEFSDHASIGKSVEAHCFFATPYHSWERGLNEHTNGLIREYIPKGTSFDDVTEQRVQEIENLLNNRPRKVLNYLTPKEVFSRAMRVDERIALRC